jgi:D-beta-D-heptose 7-phosphate kinase/D-beta-D-heptose 1-phosphate adenosyltransferase
MIFKRRKIKNLVAVSGGFDPVHIGHIRMFKEAKKYGDVVAILNNDNWLMAKKGFVFMPEQERKEILESIKYIDEVVLTKHEKGTKDMSVCKELEILLPDIYANGGDRTITNIPEVDLCDQLGIKMIWNIGGGKVASSSDMVKRFKEDKNGRK